jgi:hypothetical protein
MRNCAANESWSASYKLIYGVGFLELTNKGFLLALTLQFEIV